MGTTTYLKDRFWNGNLKDSFNRFTVHLCFCVVGHGLQSFHGVSIHTSCSKNLVKDFPSTREEEIIG